MKSMMRILLRYVLSAAGVALILLAVNFSLLAAWTIQSNKKMQSNYDVVEISKDLVQSGGGYTLSEAAENRVTANHQWAMLIDRGSGRVVWSFSLPGDVPLSYTVSDVASFTRWYLKDYPVTAWEHPDGLFVLGGEKNSLWKYSISEPMAVMDRAGIWITVILVGNGLVAILLALLFGLRLFRAIKEIAKGIEDMAGSKPVELPARGLLGDLAEGINRTSEQLARQDAELKKRDDARTRWIAGVSHDIRTPLSLVMGYASQLENDPVLPPDRREQAGVIRRQSERIKTLVSDLNLASKLEYDMQPLKMTTVPLAALLRGIAADFYNAGMDSRYKITVMVGEDARDAAVTGDDDLLRRAVSNLITNSVRHNPGGCAVSVSLEKEPSACLISVSDSGVGFPLDILENLKQPANTAGLEGRGLGLIIVRQIVTAHGGTAEFRNLPEGGCEVILQLPRAVMGEKQK